MVNDNSWIEPSRLCLEQSSISLNSVQGWLCWAAIYARWFIRGEYISFQRVDATTAVLQFSCQDSELRVNVPKKVL